MSLLLSFTAVAACASTTSDKTTDMANASDTTSVKVEVTTTLGSFTVLLYGDTPAHRDNFLKLVKDGYYDGTLFHRVIDGFMIQAGDPDSRTAKPGQRLGSGNPGYTIEAEFVYPKHFHKRGALAAARTGDGVNPQKRSSGSQFYVVTGRVYNERELNRMDENLMARQKQAIFGNLAKDRMDAIRSMQQAGDTAGLTRLQEELVSLTEELVAANPSSLTPQQRDAYSTIGGTPHLDGDYTVFGEVVSGMDVIDRIEKAETDSSDRPKEDIRILSMKVVD